MTKPVVTMLTLKLVEAGQWDLNEPLCHYWVDPDIANDPRHKKLTTRHVLTHQTGFPNWRWDRPSQKLAFDFEPGAQYQYSGEGFEYLKKALARKFNMPLYELLNSVIFTPLGMKNTGYWGKNVNKLNYAHFHDAQGNECQLPYPMGVSAADLLFTSIEDYCKFEIDVINGAGLSPKIYNDMISPHVKMREHYYRGLGWEVIRDLPDGEYALEHGGSDPGVKTIAFILPKSKRGIVVLTNGDNGMFVYNNVVRESLDTGKILIDYLSNSYTHKAITLPDELLEKYAGTYSFSSGGSLTIVKENGSLKASGSGFPTVVLFPETEKKFFSRDVDVQLEFEGDSFNIMANGKLFCTMKKIK
jgi:CubicO group peptidase (beta-lactamase class C family)